MGEVDEIAKILRKIPDSQKHDRRDCCVRLLDELGYKKNTSVSNVKFDAFLIKAVREWFDVSPNADIVLMALGLLEGYEHDKVLIRNRRKKYLRESRHLQMNSRSGVKSYDDATEDEQKKLIENLGKSEGRQIASLAEFLLKQNIAEYIETLDGYITKGENPKAILPKPSYSLSDSSDETEPTSTDAKIKVRHAKKFNSNHNKNTIVVKIINIIGGDNPSKPKNPTSGGKDTPGTVHIVKARAWVKQHKVVSSFAVLCCALLVFLSFPWQRNHSPASTDAQIKVPEETIIMQPGGAYKMSPVLLSGASMEMKDAEFSYISSNPNIVQVLQGGLLCAQNELADGASVSAEITIQGPDNVTQKIAVTVEKSASSDVPPTVDKNDFDLAYTLETQVRLVGDDKTWNNSVEAKVGDKVEIRMAYKNNDTADQLNVGIKNVLPAGLKYIPGTTMIVNAKYPNGGTVQDDNVVKQGINIGSYTPGSNAFVRFQAEVVDEGLECGSNTLVSWGQAGVNKTNLEDYATVHVVKD